jgi:hypothetical protein
LFSGKEIEIDGEKFILPSVSLGMLRNGMLQKFKEHDERLTSGASFYELMQLRGEIILAALRRNYPDFSEDKLYAFLDLANVAPIWTSVLGLSGFTPGEVQAAIAATSGISDPSTAASPPLMDGLTTK